MRLYPVLHGRYCICKKVRSHGTIFEHRDRLRGLANERKEKRKFTRACDPVLWRFPHFLLCALLRIGRARYADVGLTWVREPEIQGVERLIGVSYENQTFVSQTDGAAFRWNRRR